MSDAVRLMMVLLTGNDGISFAHETEHEFSKEGEVNLSLA